ncbi:MAG: hypothetical protein Q8O74_00355, partial [bacterium]|nr:hypothetical protein [bacterium]
MKNRTEISQQHSGHNYATNHGTDILEIFPQEVKIEQNYSATFAGNMVLPIHKWYRYTAGFSASWAKQLIELQKSKGRTRVIDPFAGSGTVLLESEFENVESMGLESHPYIYR